MNTHYNQGKEFVEGFFGKIKNVINAKPSERIAALTGGKAQDTNVASKLAKSARKIKELNG